MSPELLASLAQFGAIGIFCYYLWKENQSLRDELRTERQRHRDEITKLRGQHREEVAELREEITKRDRERFKESSNYATTLWQILTATNTIAEHVRRQSRRIGATGDRQDDQ